MSPKKNTQKHRDATVVYPCISPQLMLAYRIFGPGHNTLEALVEQRHSIIKPHGPEDEEGRLTPLGMDISKCMNVNVDEIKAAYKTYKKEIKRMNKADRILAKRKQAQLDGVDPEDIDEEEDEDDDDSDDSDEFKSSSSGSGGDQDDQNGSDEDENNQDNKIPKIDEDRFKQYLSPELWLSKEEALERALKLRATIEEMNKTVQVLLDNWSEEIPAGKECNQAMDKSVNRFLDVRRLAWHIEKRIRSHDNSKPARMWISPDLRNVTYGEKVTQTIWFLREHEKRVGWMEKALIVTERVRVRFMAATTVADKKQLWTELLFNLRRFGAMASNTHEGRAKFINDLAEERRRFSPSPSPVEEEFFPDRIWDGIGPP